MSWRPKAPIPMEGKLTMVEVQGMLKATKTAAQVPMTLQEMIAHIEKSGYTVTRRMHPTTHSPPL